MSFAFLMSHRVHRELDKMQEAKYSENHRLSQLQQISYAALFRACIDLLAYIRLFE